MFLDIQTTDLNARNDHQVKFGVTQVSQLEEMVNEIFRESKTSLPQEEVKLTELNEATTDFVELEEITSTTASSTPTLLIETTIEAKVEEPIQTTTTTTVTTTTSTTVMPTTIPTTAAATKTTVAKFILVQPGNKTLKVVNEEIHSMANCPDVDCEFGYKTDLYGKTLCACYNPCWVIN